jgi:hypothetical protein
MKKGKRKRGNKLECIKKKKKQELIILKKENEEESIERYFFKYAFPCAGAKVKLGSMRKEEFEKLKELFLQNSNPDKETLEKDFNAAFSRIKKLAEKMNKEIWDFEVIKEYWEKNHNEIIERGEGMYGSASESFKDFCKIHKAKIIEKKGDKLIVEYDNKTRIVSDFLVPDAKIGDIVTIHYAYAVEKVK